jgi:hypothetical protein
MKKITIAFLLCFCSLGLAGCFGSAPITQTQYLVIEPDKQMLGDCDVEPPPVAQAYAMKTAGEKEKTLYRYAEKLQNNLNKCNRQWDELRSWLVKQTQIYSKKE